MRNCLGFFWDFLGGIFWIFLGFFGRIFWEDFFWGGFYAGNFLFILLKSANLFESERDWCFCQDFVSIKKEGKKFRSLEVRRKLIALKNAKGMLKKHKIFFRCGSTHLKIVKRLMGYPVEPHHYTDNDSKLI